MSNISVNFSVAGTPSGNVSVDETTVVYTQSSGGNVANLTANCYNVNQTLLYLLQEQAVGNIVIAPGANFQVTLTP
jgi:hypothetical protein